MSVVRYLVELDELCSSLREEEFLDWQGVFLLPAVLQSLVNNLLPGSLGTITQEHLELLHAAVPAVTIVGVNQLHQVNRLLTAEVQHKLRTVLPVWSQPVVRSEDLQSGVGQQFGHSKGVPRVARCRDLFSSHHMWIRITVRCD